MVSKTLFERLSFPGEEIVLVDSVRRNIQAIFDSRMLLDGDVHNANRGLVPSLVEQGADSHADLDTYKERLEQLILRFEPRVKAVEISDLSFREVGNGKCELKLQVLDMDLVEDFQF
ncbi:MULTISPECIES: hypothetical protein [unclassified Agarivorans]|uniref:hypothetical protein n=1 Tax=unclassified Agarivorans TaxID=2636026 RepID=UPI003D7DC365